MLKDKKKKKSMQDFPKLSKSNITKACAWSRYIVSYQDYTETDKAVSEETRYWGDHESMYSCISACFF